LTFAANNAIQGTVWKSAIIFNKDEVVTWESCLVKYDLIEAIRIAWDVAPNECEI